MGVVDKIKEIRLNFKKSQAEFAEILNLPRYVVSNWEQGRSKPTIDDLINIADCFNVSTDYLVGRSEDEIEELPEKIEGSKKLRLRELRKERSKTTREMADILNVTKSTYNHWETDRSEPNITMLKALADFFCVSIDYLVGADERRYPNSPAAELSEDEKELLSIYKDLSDNGKNILLANARNTAQFDVKTATIKKSV